MTYPTSTSILDVSQEIERLRKRKKISQEKMAESVGVSTQTYRRWKESAFQNTKVSDFILLLKCLERTDQ